MKVLSIIPGDKSYKNNPRNFMQRQADALSDNGVVVECYYLESRINPFDIIKNLFNCYKKYKSTKIELVHSNYGTVTSVFGLVLSKLLNVPHAVTFHGSDLNNTSQIHGKLRTKISRGCSLLSAKYSTKVICVSEQLKNKVTPFTNKEVLISPVGINSAHFKFSNDDRLFIRKRLGVPDSAKLVIFNAGFNQPVKRKDLFDKYFINKEDDDIFSIVIEGNISQGEMPSYLSAADVLVILSDSEGSPTIVKEALACSLPIVSLDVGDVKDSLSGLDYSSIVGSAEEAYSYVSSLPSSVRELKGPISIKSLSLDAKACEIINYLFK